MTLSEMSSDEQDIGVGNDSSNGLGSGGGFIRSDDNDFVQLVFTENLPLGMEIYRHRNGVLSVVSVNDGGQAEQLCIDALLEPEVFDGAVVLAINGVRFDSEEDSIPLYSELRSKKRPKQILFALRTLNKPDIRHAFGVNKICGHLVELVFTKDLLGIRVDSESDENLLKVEEFTEPPPKKPNTRTMGIKGRNVRLSMPRAPVRVPWSVGASHHAADVATNCLLDPKIFVDAFIVGVNGRKYSDKVDMYEALRSPNRPKFVLFELARYPKTSKLFELASAAKPLAKLEAMRHIDDDTSSSTTPNGTSKSKNAADTPRLASSLMLEKAVYASKSMRQFAGTDPVDDSYQQHRMKGQAAFVADSMKKLERCLGEMEQLNQTIEEENENQRRVTESITQIHDMNASNQAEMSRAPTRGRMDRLKNMNLGVSDSLRSRFKRLSSTSAELAEEEEMVEHQRLKSEAYEACLKAIREHLEAFIAETPEVSFEEWIEELHPENSKARRTQKMGRSIDHRFYVEHSDHRRLWNDNLGHGREYVPIRDYITANDHYDDTDKNSNNNNDNNNGSNNNPKGVLKSQFQKLKFKVNAMKDDDETTQDDSATSPKNQDLIEIDFS